MSNEVTADPLNLDQVLGRVKNRVALVGVELEGAWVTLPPGAMIEPDSSVFNNRCPAGAKHVGEVPVGPVTPAAIGTLIKAFHPPKVNSTCGMHVHMSFDTLWYYQLLMVPEYQSTMLKYLTLWAKEQKAFKDDHHIWERLNNKSRYCQNKFWPDAQASQKRKGHDQSAYGHRYTHVHYCGRPGMNTIEIRTLPMMEKVRMSISAVHRVIDITNASLYLLGPKMKKDAGAAKVTLPNNLVYEETIIEQI